MERYICIHGHFYQPPRENPWLEAIELQDSAYPYHDWNERITAECYAPNTASRILDGEGRIVGLSNNYAKISFNFGPTLLAWLEEKAPDVYAAILEAERESQRRYGGHSSALAQAYNHMILPLANRRDKVTQVVWGIRDYERRFGHAPEGMWLPETAVDLETLEVLAEQGIRFTVLAPHQAQRVRRLGVEEWQDVSGGRIDPRRPYLLRLPSGRTIALFFYDGPISRAVAFEGLLSNGERFAQRLLAAFEDVDRPQLVHIADDGETYGHHHRHGDMALAYALHFVETTQLARLTNYAEYLERHPPTDEVEVLENTSWSCAHGVERWRSDCGCSTGAHPQWDQAWRRPLREALDWLRDTLALLFEEMGARLLKDPWAARDDYIAVILDRSPESLGRFFAKHAAHELDEAERIKAIKLLEMQRHAMLMYTSCGWFFDDLSGIETVQVLQYAGRALQLAEELTGRALEPQFLALLARARSNLAAYGDGAQVYERFVRPARVDFRDVTAHYAVSSLFEEYPETAEIYCYTFDRQDLRRLEAGRAKLAAGRVCVRSKVTGESALLSFGVLHWGDHNLNCGVRYFQGEEAYAEMVQELEEAFSRADFAEVLRLLDKHFGGSTYSLRSLFRDEQRKVLDRIMESSLRDAEALYRQVYEYHAPLMSFLTELGVPVPRALRFAAEHLVNSELRRAIENEEPDMDRVRSLLEEARERSIPLDVEGLRYALTRAIERLSASWRAQPHELSLLQRLDAVVGVAVSTPVNGDLWRAQNAYYETLRGIYPALRAMAEAGDEGAQAWVQSFRALGDKLAVRVE